VIVRAESTGAGRLRVTVTAGTTPATPINRLVELRFGAGTNTLVDVGGQTGRSGSFTVPLADRPATVSFVVQRAIAGQASHLPFTVVDVCGLWPTFVGGGPSAF
jgi:hypothetical protein